jgi:hypothetical protein
MNAALTWWGVSLALLSHQGLGNEILGREALLSGVPVFVAALVWLIRVLMIGTLTLAGERLFTVGERRSGLRVRQIAALRPTTAAEAARPSPPPTPRPLRAAPKPPASRDEVFDEAAVPDTSSYRR